MEQHPVPQNVTTFQFRLIGDMTLKQFGYLCAGAILAFICYRLPLPFIVTWPLAFCFAFLGVGFAFIPVEERPMDVWVFSFFKSIYNPTQYIWTKEAPKNPTPPTKPAPVAPTPIQTKAVLSTIFQPAHQPMPQPAPAHQKSSPLTWLVNAWNPPSHPVSVAGIKPPTPPPVPVAQKPTHDSALVTQQKVTQLETSLKTLQEQLATKTVTSERVLELQQQLTDELKQKNAMQDELISLKRQIEPPPKPANGEPSTQSTVTVINTQEAATKAGLPRLTNVSNVITGLVKDNEGNLLPSILVTVTNGDGIPVRALKTNKLGQFAASTPVSSGVYFVEIEDPRSRFTFSRVQITLNGTVVPALEIIAKSQKQLTREKLAQEIFGGNTI